MNKQLTFLTLIGLLDLVLSYPTLSNIDLATFNTTQGVALQGLDAQGGFGCSVSTAGDINNDGIADIIIGECQTDTLGEDIGGVVYVMYGNKNGFPNISLTSFDNSQGFTITTSMRKLDLGSYVSNAGDVNNDGIADISLGANNGAFVIFGKEGGHSNIDLDNLADSQGFEFKGYTSPDFRYTVGSAGDINGDNITDLIFGGCAKGYYVHSGVATVIYGKSSNLSTIDILTLDNSQGFSISLDFFDDNFACAASIVPDINGDHIDDILIGGDNAYVIYGSQGGLSNIIADKLNSSQGFNITSTSGTNLFTVSGAGDINNDGNQDILIGNSLMNASYVIFGKQDGSFSNIDLSNLNNADGFTLTSSDLHFGTSVAGIGDINHDNIDDIIITSPLSSPNSRPGAGSGLIIYGSRNQSSNINVSSLSSTQGFQIMGVQANFQLGGAYDLAKLADNAGDVNGDGLNDLIIGAINGASYKGQVFIIYGRCPNEQFYSHGICSDYSQTGSSNSADPSSDDNNGNTFFYIIGGSIILVVLIIVIGVISWFSKRRAVPKKNELNLQLNTIPEGSNYKNNDKESFSDIRP